MVKDLSCLAADLGSLIGKPQASTATSETDETDADELNAGRSVQVKSTINRHQMRRILSEAALERELPWHFEQGTSYHCVSWGDVDALTYLRVIVKQQRVKFCILSTWCMASEDVREIREWIERGLIGRVDFYVGEIFKASYYRQYEELQDLCRTLGGKVSIFRNHSKVMVIFGERFDAVVESSANINTNPRVEQCVITVDSELAAWYKNFFDGIKSFERNFDHVPPWTEGDAEIDGEDCR